MSRAITACEAQSKHLTSAERQARVDAEESLTRHRPAKIKPPKDLSPAARKYWNSFLKRAKEIEILDTLDAEILGVYCQLLCRRDSLNLLCEQLLTQAVEGDSAAENTKNSDKLDSLLTKLATLERSIMTYADKLGFTPQSRARLAQRRASAVEDPDSDFFGD